MTEEVKDQTTEVANNPDVSRETSKIGETNSKVRTYTDEDVDQIVSRRRTRWLKEEEKKIDNAVKEATDTLSKELNDLKSQLQTIQDDNVKIKTESIRKDKMSHLKNELSNENVIDVNLLVPHVDLESITISEDGKIELGETISNLKSKFPTAFGTKTNGTGGVPAGHNSQQPLTDVQRANQHIQNKDNKSAIAQLLRAGKI